MHKSINTIHKIFLVLVIIMLIIRIYPNAVILVGGISKLSDGQINNIITALDVIMFFVVSIYSYMEQKKTEERCVYEFQIEKDNLNFEKYRRYDTDSQYAYMYTCHRDNNDIQEPYYGVDVKLERNAICSVGIPLRMSVLTNLDGNSIEISKLNVVAKRNGKVVAEKKLSNQILKIDMPIRESKIFLIRVKLLCNQKLEKILLDSRICLKFTILIKGERGRKNKKSISLNIQNIMGQSKILSVAS